MNTMLKSVTQKTMMIALLYPYIVGFRPNGADTSWTEIGFAVGKGPYAEVRRDCQGNIVSVADIPFD